MQFVLIRHPAVLIAPGTCYGRLDLDLHPDAADAAARLAAIVDDRLRELDFGGWEGLAWDTVPRAALDAWAAAPADFAPPCGESGAALLARVAAFQADLRAQAEDCVVVSHGGPLKLLAALLRGAVPDLLAPAPPLGSVTTILC